MQTVAKCVPEMHKVKLDNPEVYILIEIFKVSHSTEQYSASKIDISLERMRYEYCEGLLRKA